MWYFFAAETLMESSANVNAPEILHRQAGGLEGFFSCPVAAAPEIYRKLQKRMESPLNSWNVWFLKVA